MNLSIIIIAFCLGDIESPTKFSLKFNQIYLSKPTHWEKDGTPTPMMPNEVCYYNILIYK